MTKPKIQPMGRDKPPIAVARALYNLLIAFNVPLYHQTM
jgi:hypothetical protein